MRRVLSLLCLLCLGASLTGCDGFFLFVSTGPLPNQRQSPTSPPATAIVIGDVVHSTFVSPEVCFDVRSPASGILFVNLSWDPRNGDVDFSFASSVGATEVTRSNSTSERSVGRTLRVAAGQTYRIAVVGNREPVPFMLTTSLE
jgi:hypothetical protein